MFINVRINKPFGGHAEGQMVKVLTDGSGTPLDQGWRRRLKDAELDQCCEVVEDKPKAKKPTVNKSQKAED